MIAIAITFISVTALALFVILRTSRYLFDQKVIVKEPVAIYQYAPPRAEIYKERHFDLLTLDHTFVYHTKEIIERRHSYTGYPILPDNAAVEYMKDKGIQALARKARELGAVEEMVRGYEDTPDLAPYTHEVNMRLRVYKERK